MYKETSSGVSLFCYDKNMQMEFPYQIVSFLDREPEVNEPVYYGRYGWYPQMTIKRRFKLDGISEENFIAELKSFFIDTVMPPISTGALTKPERMPVRVIHVTNQDEIKNLHNKLIDAFTNKIISRYPEREYENYYPHITAEYNGEFIIPTDQYINKTFTVGNVWLLKDVSDENSLAYTKII